jgi:hypothetical protein
VLLAILKIQHTNLINMKKQFENEMQKCKEGITINKKTIELFLLAAKQQALPQLPVQASFSNAPSHFR